MNNSTRNGTESSEGVVSINELHKNHSQYKRIQNLRDLYQKQFKTEPDFFVRVPGRVNIIGEHVDYCGYPVLPMAIEQSILLAVGRANDQKLILCNMESAKFNHFSCDLNNVKIELPKSGGPEWHNYYLCGVKGVQEAFETAKTQPIGMKIALCGNIPPASGLSSSSALVSASVLATAHIHGMTLNRKQLASISACCECYIGTQSGGMDQAIAYLAKLGCAQFIEFHPKLNNTPITLPAGACFVVANSLAEKQKAASSDYNERVVECRLGARWLAKSKALPNWREVIRFAQLQDDLSCTLDELEQLIEKTLTQTSYTRADICENLGVSEKELNEQFLTSNTLHMQEFKLRQRALHVIQESLRVLKFRNICEKVSTESDAEQRLRTLGELMRQSHKSLKELFECTHPHLERLISISDEMGVSARLTGAGWGGCIVALCKSIESSTEYIRVLKEKYFKQLPPHVLEQHQPNDFNNVIFATFPCSGAEIILSH